MLKTTRSHKQFQDFVKSQLQLHYLINGFANSVLINEKALAFVWSADLSKVADIVGFRYSSNKGTPARDPIDMFRSLLLMEVLRERSIDAWVNTMRYAPIFAILSGFLPDDVPGVGTFYDFIKRLWLSSSAHLARKVRKPRQRKPKKGKKKGDKSPLKRPGAVKRLVNRYIEHPPDFNSRPHDLFQKIFKECFVVPSAKHGILGNMSSLSIAGDGTSARTGASCYGKLTCDCRKNRIFKCNCNRKFSDPDASWGWDSYREEYYFGRTLYAFTAADSPYDLPVYLNFFKAYRHDSMAFVYSFFDFKQLYPEFTLKECMLDSAHDAYAIYDLLHHYDVAAFIDINKRNEGISAQDDFTFTKEGVPICPAGHIMAYHGFCKHRQRHKWRCPKTRKKWNVSCDCSCSNSAYGRVFYTREQDNLRYFTRVPRGSQLFKERFARRTTVERFFKRLKEDYLLERKSKTRSSRNWYFRVFADAMCVHVDAWIKHFKVEMRPLILQWEAEANSKAA